MPEDTQMENTLPRGLAWGAQPNLTAGSASTAPLLLHREPRRSLPCRHGQHGSVLLLCHEEHAEPAEGNWRVHPTAVEQRGWPALPATPVI